MGHPPHHKDGETTQWKCGARRGTLCSVEWLEVERGVHDGTLRTGSVLCPICSSYLADILAGSTPASLGFAAHGLTDGPKEEAMNVISDVLAILGLFVLRFGIPVFVTLGLAYLLKRLDRHWEEEARLNQQPQPSVEKRLPARPARAGVDIAGRQSPYMPSPGLAMNTATATIHCWDKKHCTEEGKALCAAFAHPDQPCWEARTVAAGQLPVTCPTCDIYQHYPLM
jgi:hypothetical protein